MVKYYCDANAKWLSPITCESDTAKDRMLGQLRTTSEPEQMHAQCRGMKSIYREIFTIYSTISGSTTALLQIEDDQTMSEVGNKTDAAAISGRTRYLKTLRSREKSSESIKINNH